MPIGLHIKKTKNGILKLGSTIGLSSLLTACGFGQLVHQGTNGDDQLTGHANAGDIFKSSLGADKINGVYGTDFHHANKIDYAASNAGVTVILDGKTSGISGHAAGDVLMEIDDIDGSGFADHLIGNGYDNEMFGGAGDDIIEGLAGDDILEGGDGDDHLIGGAGDDRFDGGAGANIIDGGAGRDQISYHESITGINVNLETGAASGGLAQGDTLINLEYVLATNFNDVIIGNAAANGFTGLAGDDVLDGGSAGDDILYAGAGDDVIISRLGNDDLNGGDGNDILSAGAGEDYLRGGAGVDRLEGGQGVDQLYGGAGIDTSIGYNSQLDQDRSRDYGVRFEIEKTDHKIHYFYNEDEDYINSIEIIELINPFADNILIDVKSIWSDLANAEQAKFSDEADFLSWLGNDAGYNYEGL